MYGWRTPDDIAEAEERRELFARFRAGDQKAAQELAKLKLRGWWARGEGTLLAHPGFEPAQRIVEE